MTTRNRLPLMLAAGFSALDLGLVSFLALGLASERLPISIRHRVDRIFLPLGGGAAGTAETKRTARGLRGRTA